MVWKRTLVLVLLLMALLPGLNGQVRFRAILLSQNDSLPMPFASIKLVEKGIYGQYTSSNVKGEFDFILNEKKPVLKLEVSTIDCHVTLNFIPAYSGLEKLYVQQSSGSLDEVVIEGLSARQVVEKAVAAIPVNYDDSGYVAYSFYRQYQKINGEYKNLAEAKMAVLFNIVSKGNMLTATEAFALEKLRRSGQVDPFNGYFGDAASGLFLQNPVLHLQESSLHPGGFKKMTFTFDSLQSEHAYIVDYITDVSSDGHGIGNYSECHLNGESREYGRLYIDRASFAIVKYERHAVRNRAYDYPLFNNFLVPERKYTVEFLDGHLTASTARSGSGGTQKGSCVIIPMNFTTQELIPKTLW